MSSMVIELPCKDVARLRDILNLFPDEDVLDLRDKLEAMLEADANLHEAQLALQAAAKAEQRAEKAYRAVCRPSHLLPWCDELEDDE